MGLSRTAEIDVWVLQKRGALDGVKSHNQKRCLGVAKVRRAIDGVKLRS